MTKPLDKNKKGRLFVLSGPSGVGKGTIINKLLPLLPNMVLSISATTREPREREKDGVHYFFVSLEQFKQTIEEGGFLEYDGHFNNFYGTPKKFVYDNLNKGNDVMLEIDVNGALKVKNSCPDAVLIFIKPLTVDVLLNRLKHRNSEDEKEIAQRIARIEQEMSQQNKYDYTVVNDDLKTAVNEVYQIIKETKKND